jgi:hypothetical protein
VKRQPQYEPYPDQDEKQKKKTKTSQHDANSIASGLPERLSTPGARDLASLGVEIWLYTLACVSDLIGRERETGSKRYFVSQVRLEQRARVQSCRCSG